MIYLKWLGMAICQLFCMILCYLTNPIVVLFADKYGNLPTHLKYWQTYDSTLDVEWMTSQKIVPNFCIYEYKKHYEYHETENGDGYMIAGYVEIIDGNFTIKERIQRYFCRLCWLYRNCAYGFAYHLFGRIYYPSESDYVSEYYQEGYDCLYFLKNKDIFCLYYKKPYGNNRYLRVYLGWKLRGMGDYKNPNKAMLAFHINPFRKIK